jgi:Flp pilus assembly protein TadG
MPQRRLSGDRGDATVESVLCVPALLIVLFTVIQFGLWYHAQHVTQAAAQEGVRAVRVETGTSDAGRIKAKDFMANAAPELVRDVTVTADRSATEATVHIHGTVRAVVPGLQLPVDAQETSSVERFEAGP